MPAARPHVWAPLQRGGWQCRDCLAQVSKPGARLCRGRCPGFESVLQLIHRSHSQLVLGMEVPASRALIVCEGCGSRGGPVLKGLQATCCPGPRGQLVSRRISGGKHPDGNRQWGFQVFSRFALSPPLDFSFAGCRSVRRLPPAVHFEGVAGDLQSVARPDSPT